MLYFLIFKFIFDYNSVIIIYSRGRSMEHVKKHYKNIDIIRLLACIAILLYHLNILRGGYLAVCTFFVLSSYLSCVSAFKKEKFNILEYYYNRIKKIYIPLIIVVFMSVAVISILNISWLNLKPETTSVLLGYNNFWQLNANMDYFARHVSSPFMHLWYISILLQYELIFPIIFKILKKIGDKVNKILPCIITIILSVVFAIHFYQSNLTQDMMIVYYNTFTRIFSLLFGLTLGFIHSYYGSLIPKQLKQDKISTIIFYIYLLILIVLFVYIDAKSIYYEYSMILTTILTCRLIDYGTIQTKKLSIFDKIINLVSSISYEIYLFQYPVIFIFQYININNGLYLPSIIIIVVLLSYILHFAINSKKFKPLKYLILIMILCNNLYGGYKYIISEDHTKEMNELKSQLEQNEKLIEKNKEKYALQLQKETDEWEKTLESLNTNENSLKELVSNLPITGIGDSVMLGAIQNLNDQFPNGYIDAKVSRTAWKAGAILNELNQKNMLGNPIIVNLGANGDCSTSCKEEIMRICGNRNIYWLNTTNNQDTNKRLQNFAKSYPNLHIIDWYTISLGHSEYFYADGIHLTGIGRKVYTEVIFNAIYQDYLNEFNAAKQALINKHDEELKNKITFYGNNMLLNAFENVQSEFNNAKYVINKDFDYKSLKEEIEKSKNDNSITYKIVFVFDNSSNLSLKDYQNLIELCKSNEIYILSINNFTNNIVNENVKIINFYQEIQDNSDYIMIDGLHLTDKGNKALAKILKEEI